MKNASKMKFGIPVVAALLIGLHVDRAQAQGAPLPPPPRVTPSGGQSASPSGGRAGAATTPPVVVPAPVVPTPPKTVVPASAVPPKDSAVALCNNGTWVMRPGSPSDCASRGGLRIAVAQRTASPPALRQVAATVAHPALVARAAPAGTTMQCKDGTYLSGVPAAARCAGNGGVAAIFPAAKTAPPGPSKAPQKRP